MVYLFTSFSVLAPHLNSLPKQNQRLRKHSNCQDFIILHSIKCHFNHVFIFFRVLVRSIVAGPSRLWQCCCSRIIIDAVSAMFIIDDCGKSQITALVCVFSGTNFVPSFVKISKIWGGGCR